MAAASLLLHQRHTSHLNAHPRSALTTRPAAVGAGALLLLCRLLTRVQDAGGEDLGATSIAAGCWAFLSGGGNSSACLGGCCWRPCCCCGAASCGGAGPLLPV